MYRDAWRVILAEWFKIRKSRATVAGLIAYILILGVIYIAYAVATQRSFLGIESGFYLSGAVCSAATTPLAFAALLLVAFSIGREFSQGTIHLVWSRPITRSGWLLGKLKASGIHLGLFVILTFVLTIIVAGLDVGFSDLMEKDYLIHSESTLWWRFILVALLTWVAASGVVVVAAVPALYLANPGGALTVSLVVGFILQLATGWEAISPYLLPTYLAAPFDQFVAMAKGLPLPEEWGTLTRNCLIGTLVWIMAGWLWAWWLVRRKEVLN